MGRGRPFGTTVKKQNGRWAARFSHEGQKHSAGVTFATEAEARKWLATQQADILRGVFQAEDTQQVGRDTLTEYAVSWLRTGTQKQSTKTLYADQLGRIILPVLGGFELRDITPQRVREWHDGVTNGKTAKAQSYRLLKAVMNQAVKDGQITANPCTITGAGNPKTENRPIVPVEDVVRLSNTVPDHHRVLVLVAGFSGLRLGELLALTREDVVMLPGKPMRLKVSKTAYDLPDGRHVGSPKTEAGNRTVTLPASLAVVLDQHLRDKVGREPSSLLFTNNVRKPLTRHAVGQAFKKAVRKLGLDDGIHFHDLRHTAALLTAHSGAAIPEIMRRIGHSSPKAALIYLAATDERDDEIAANIDLTVNLRPSLRAVEG
jgi:integrase